MPTSHAAVRHGVSWGKAHRAEKAFLMDWDRTRVTRPPRHIGLDESMAATAIRSELQYYAKADNPAERFDPGGRHARPPVAPDELERVMNIVGDVPGTLAERCSTGAG